MILFKGENAELEMHLDEVGESGQPSEGDRRYVVKIRSTKVILREHSFWVEKTAWEQFCKDACKVLFKNKGSAALRGMSPGSLQLVIEATPPGYMRLIVNINELSSGRKGFPKMAFYLEDALDSKRNQELIEILSKQPI